MEIATSDCVCNQSLMNRLLSDEYYQETFTKRTDRARCVISMKVADLEAEAWDSEKPAEVVNADHVSSIFSSMSSICA
jgi:hypothetical protein